MAQGQTVGDDRYSPASTWHPHHCPVCGEFWNHHDYTCNQKYQHQCSQCREWTGENE